MARFACLAPVVLILCVVDASADDDLALNRAIVAFCQRNLGEKVGDGDCAALANAALRDCDGRDNRKKDFPKKGDYVWGEQVFLIEIVEGKRVIEGDFFDIRPGDILQLRDTVWKGKIEKDGKIKKIEAHSGHHTAIVGKVQSPGRPVGAGWELSVYEQNSKGRHFITKGEYGLDDLKEGWVRVYRPQPKKK